MTQNTLWQPSDISNTDTEASAGIEGGEQESPKRRGRIPQSAWPQILERYRAGATLSAIAREFECTPSAISYIVRKAEASNMVTSEEGDSPETAPTPADTPASQPVPHSPDAPKPAGVKPVSDAPKPRLELKREGPRPTPDGGEAVETPVLAAAAVATPSAAPVPAPTTAPAPASTTASVAVPAGAPAPRRAEPTPPVDEVEARLRETARGCLSTYRAWRQQPGQGSIQTLSDAVHDLRKVLARIEIDMSANRREEQVAQPIPIPVHRAARRPQ